MSMAIKYNMAKRAKKMAEGGAAGDQSHRRDNETVNKSVSSGRETSDHPMHKGERGTSQAGLHTRAMSEGHPREFNREKAKESHESTLANMKAQKRPNLYAEGGLVDRVMAKRGVIANGTPPVADGESADYDVLDDDDTTEADYTGENSGDELGEDRVSRAMKRRKGTA